MPSESRFISASAPKSRRKILKVQSRTKSIACDKLLSTNKAWAALAILKAFTLMPAFQRRICVVRNFRSFFAPLRIKKLISLWSPRFLAYPATRETSFRSGISCESMAVVSNHSEKISTPQMPLANSFCFNS